MRQPTEDLPGIDLNIEVQHKFLLELAALYPEFLWGEQRDPRFRFYLAQGYYRQADSLALYGMLRLHRPRRIVEVGSGYSSALVLDVNEHFLGGKARMSFIEPHPERLFGLLRPSDRDAVEIIQRPVQETSKEIFELQPGDFLIIDSSHVSKVASDVNHLMLNVLPNLPIGAIVHIHDIFWPFEYPDSWIAEGLAWNEAYLVRSFLTFNDRFEVLFWVPFAALRWRSFIEQNIPLYLRNTGAALWLRRCK